MTGAGQTTLKPGLLVPAPATGVYLGANKSGPVSLRLFRPRGTRIVIFSGAYAAQLLALRAALSGAAVRVMSDREGAWSPALRHGVDVRLVPASGQLPHPTPSPCLVVEDRGGDPRPLSEVADWQCLLDIRTIEPGDPAASDVSRLANAGQADVAVFGVLSTEMAAAAGSMFGLGDAAAALTVVPRHAVAVVARGSVQLVRLDATAGEREALRPRS